MSIDRLHPSLGHNIANTLLWPGLRPLRASAVEPILDGEDAILLAPTADGKTEAAAFPLLTAMAVSSGGPGSACSTCTTTFLSHASLSVDERRQAETAFAEGRDCVFVATSTLELGIDIGDLDRVIQINAPRTVASFLQRIGRTGRRAGTVRNCLFLALDEEGLLDATGLLRLWGDHWVEPVTAPPDPAHIVAQQVLALCLQGRVGDRLWPSAWNGLAPFDAGAKPIVDFLAAEVFLDNDGGMFYIGPNAERRFGARHFAGLTAVFCSPPEFTVMHGRDEIGKIDPAVLETEPDAGPGVILLAGRSWTPVHLDWKRQRCQVEPSGERGSFRWNPMGVPSGRTFHTTTRPPGGRRTQIQRGPAERSGNRHPGGPSQRPPQCEGGS